MDCFLGEIRLLAFQWAPNEWVPCNGAILPIDQHMALYTIIGNTYGGVFPTTFALPNLQGCAPIGMGGGSSLSTHSCGEISGGETVTLSPEEIPTHRHTIIYRSADDPLSKTGEPSVITALSNTAMINNVALMSFAAPDAPLTSLAPETMGKTGFGQPHENRQPYLAVNFCIALTGTYPERD